MEINQEIINFWRIIELEGTHVPAHIKNILW